MQNRHKTKVPTIIILVVMKMTGVIYADVLFILNTYITYAMLILTAFFLHISPSRLRILWAGVIGGLASLLVLCDFAHEGLLGLIRLVLGIVLPLVSFGFSGIRFLARQIAVFLAVNFLFAGIMLALWYFVSPTAVYYNSGIVYFDIDALSLVVLTAVCYFAVRIFRGIIDLKAPKNTLYDVYLTVMGEEFYLRGFLDTGNNLSDPFTGSDVIIVSRSALEKYFPSGEDMSRIIEISPLKIRYLPCKTVSGTALMPVFRCDKVRIKGVSADFVCKGAVIGITDEKIKNAEFQALLPAGIFHNNFSDKGEDYEEAKRFLV